MEGYLLVFSRERSAQVHYCVLEHGMLRCFDRPGGVLCKSVGLTRHQIRVQLLFSDNTGLCPNRFAVHALEVQRNHQADAFVAASKCETTHLFAAVTSHVMTKWANAIHNWRRHAFDDPTSSALSVQDAHASKGMPNSGTRQRALLLESQRATLVNLANRFDVKIISGKGRSRSSSSFRKMAAHNILSGTQMPRSSFAIRSWLPGVSSLRLSLPGS
uniref:PH domain-containing protein n=1 Tax=Peronospora matthiolae TaxID=2874970 RepID=A0AAV1UK93_9STRA